MRLTPDEIEIIRSSARRHFGAGCTVRLFGSRVDDTLRGGDIDLHIVAESVERADLKYGAAFQAELEARWEEEERIDVIVRPPGYEPMAIDAIAVARGIVL